mgnify:CR=1 FL=1
MRKFIFIFLLISFNVFPNKLYCKKYFNYKAMEDKYSDSLDQLMLKISEIYQVSYSTVQELSSDPDHNYAIEFHSVIEAAAGLEFKRKFLRDCELYRGGAGIEFLDCDNKAYDVKSPQGEGSTPSSYMVKSIIKKLENMVKKDYSVEAIILNLSFINTEKAMSTIALINQKKIFNDSRRELLTVCLRPEIFEN